MRDALITLRANLTTRSTACRHALRLTAILTLAAAVARVLELPRGYWLPMTIALVLKPDSRDTFVFSIARVAGTLLGAAGATAITLLLAPGPIALIVLVLGFAWGAYAFRIANYTLWPFGRTLRPKPTAGVASGVGNVIWFVLFGWWLALGHIVLAVAQFVSVIGIPLGIANLKLVPVSVLPLGREIVPAGSSTVRSTSPHAGDA